MGSHESGWTAKDIRYSFDNITLALLVGVAAGAPFTYAKKAGSVATEELVQLAGINPDKEREKAARLERTNIKLGDVIISTQVTEWDFGSQYEDRFVRKTEYENTLRKADRSVTNFLNNINEQYTRDEELLPDVRRKDGLQTKYAERPDAPDFLYASRHRHKHHDDGTRGGAEASKAGVSERKDLDGSSPCLICKACAQYEEPVCGPAPGLACKQLGCEPVITNLQGDANIHFGRVASGNAVVKSAKLRNKLIEEENYIGFEMEGVGVWEVLPTIVVKGVVDYADSHKNKEWREYPAARAALSPALERFLQNQSIASEATEKAAAIVSFRNRLFVTNPVVDRATLEDPREKGLRSSGKCEWLKGCGAYDSWLAGSAQTLAITGEAGKGKTMLSIYLTRALEAVPHIIYFFCTSDDDRRNNAAAVLRTWLWQLSEKNIKIAESLLALFGTDERQVDIALRSSETLWSAFEGVMANPDLEPIVCILDGPDECDDSSNAWLMEKLLKRLPETMKARGSTSKVVVVGRPGFGHLAAAHIDLDVEYAGKVEEDSETFITLSVRELVTKLQTAGKYPGEQFTREVEQVFRERSEGTFLWVGYAMSELKQKQTATAMQTTLQEIPPGVHRVYGRMLSRLNGSDEQKVQISMVLRWVAMAFRPLSILELAVAVEIHGSGGIDTREAMHDRLSMAAPLLKIRDEQVTFVHKSVKDYVLKEAINADGVRRDPLIEPENANFAMVKTCLDLIERSELLRTTYQQCNDEAFADRWLKEYVASEPLLHYAVDYWPLHMAATGHFQASLLDWPSGFFDSPSALCARWWKVYSCRSPWLLDEASSVHIAAHFGILTWLHRLLERPWYRALSSKPADQRDEWGLTALHYAAAEGRRDVVEMLLTVGKADVRAKDFEGYPARRVALDMGYADVAQLLDFDGADREPDEMDMIKNF